MYYAKSMRDLLIETQLNMEFFDSLDNFHLQFIDMCFKQSIDEKMGLMGNIEAYNYQLFEEHKLIQLEKAYGLDPEILKSAA